MGLFSNLLNFISKKGWAFAEPADGEQEPVHGKAFDPEGIEIADEATRILVENSGLGWVAESQEKEPPGIHISLSPVINGVVRARRFEDGIIEIDIPKVTEGDDSPQPVAYLLSYDPPETAPVIPGTADLPDTLTLDIVMPSEPDHVVVDYVEKIAKSREFKKLVDQIKERQKLERAQEPIVKFGQEARELLQERSGIDWRVLEWNEETDKGEKYMNIWLTPKDDKATTKVDHGHSIKNYFQYETNSVELSVDRRIFQGKFPEDTVPMAVNIRMKEPNPELLAYMKENLTESQNFADGIKSIKDNIAAQRGWRGILGNKTKKGNEPLQR